ncbi:MAG: alpha/beta fold hydrolase [Candidatus Promineifilaceae bacterium]
MTTDQTVNLGDGRALGFADCGDPAGKAVFYFHGSGGSRLGRPADTSILTDLQVRFISVDRPGHGLSDPQPDRKLLDWPDDIGQLADQLGLETFYIMGWSAGGPHALACAYKMPRRVLACAIISGVGPPERPKPYQGLPLPNRILMFGARRMPRLVHLIRRMAYRMVTGDPGELGQKLANSFPQVDRELLLVLEQEKMFVMDIREGYRQGWQGPAQDDIIVNRPWGFRLEDIKPRIDIWQGEIDENVPLNQGLYLHEWIPTNRFMLVKGQAHAYLLVRWRELLAALVS